MSYVKKILKAVLEEEPLNDPKQTRARLKACFGCESYNSKKGKCRNCGCYVEIKAEMKINRNPKKGMRLEITHCPLGKWDDDPKVVKHYSE